MKGIGYIRVSTNEQANEGISLENQRVKINAYAKLNDIEIVEIIEDAGKSGKNLKRDGIQDLLSKIQDKEINTIVVYKLDRLSRKVLDTLNIIETFIIETFEKNDIGFHSINEKIDTTTAMGRFFLNITASLAQMERDLISERTKDALQLKISKHERAGQLPYGWRLATEGKTLVEDEKEQEVIRLVKELKAKGYSLRAICIKLTEKEYKPIGKKWHPQTIKNILDRKVA